MTARGGAADLYARLEAEVRTPRETIALDAFLPPAAAIPSAFAPPPPPPAATEPPPAGATISLILRTIAPDEDQPAAAPPPPRRRPVKKRDAREKTLEEEIAEFMSRDNSALAPDRDPT